MVGAPQSSQKLLIRSGARLVHAVAVCPFKQTCAVSYQASLTVSPYDAIVTAGRHWEYWG
jgi:hypothetical protein